MSQAPVAAYFGPHDDGFAACLLLDLRARGLDVHPAVDLNSAPISGLIVIRSWFAQQPSFDAATVAAQTEQKLRRLVVRRNATKLHRDEGFGGWAHMALWNDYYQPERSLGGKGAGGIANVLEFFLGKRVNLDLPNGYVFVSYHHKADGEFVREWLRPALAKAGMTSWDYRMSERIPDPTSAAVPDPAIVARLHKLIQSASALIVVATESWSSPYSQFELSTARELGIPIFGVRRHDTAPSQDPTLGDLPIRIVHTSRPVSTQLISDLNRAVNAH
jgi:hypothetical protein